MELEQTKASLQEEFIHQNTARMNVAAAREKKEQTEQGYGDLQNEQREIASQIEEIQNGKEEIRRAVSYTHLDVYKRQALMMPHRVCKACGSYNKREIINTEA